MTSRRTYRASPRSTELAAVSRGLRAMPWLVSGALWLLSSVALAQLESDTGPDRTPTGEQASQPPAEPQPWAASVSQEDQDTALKLYREGNALLREAHFADALVRYERALTHWDHPRIHFHIALARVQLGHDPVETHQSIRDALRYGGKALKPDQVERARDLTLLLRRQLVQLEVVRAQPGVEIRIDGSALPSHPKTVTRLFAPGRHRLSARKPGFVPTQHELVLIPGEDRRVRVKLFTLDEVSVTSRRLPNWIPWTASGVGAALVLSAGVLHSRARRHIQDFDRQLLQQCPTGCPDDAPNSPSALLRRGEKMQLLSVAGYITGGVALAAGVALAFINRPETRRVDRSTESIRFSVVPQVSSSELGLSAAGRF